MTPALLITYLFSDTSNSPRRTNSRKKARYIALNAGCLGRLNEPNLCLVLFYCEA